MEENQAYDPAFPTGDDSEEDAEVQSPLAESTNESIQSPAASVQSSRRASRIAGLAYAATSSKTNQRERPAVIPARDAENMLVQMIYEMETCGQGESSQSQTVKNDDVASGPGNKMDVPANEASEVSNDDDPSSDQDFAPAIDERSESPEIGEICRDFDVASAGSVPADEIENKSDAMSDDARQSSSQSIIDIVNDDDPNLQPLGFEPFIAESALYSSKLKYGKFRFLKTAAAVDDAAVPRMETQDVQTTSDENLVAVLAADAPESTPVRSKPSMLGFKQETEKKKRGRKKKTEEVAANENSMESFGDKEELNDDDSARRRSSRIRSIEDKKEKVKQQKEREDRIRHERELKERDVKPPTVLPALVDIRQADSENLSTQFSLLGGLVRPAVSQFIPPTLIGKQVSSSHTAKTELGSCTPLQDENVPKAEKVKSRWRRNSELEVVHKDPHRAGYTVNSLPSVHDGGGGGGRYTPTRSCSFNKENEPSKPNNYEDIADNIYLADKKRNRGRREAKRMQCDCTTTKDDIARGDIPCGSECLNRMLYIECGSRCSTGEHCTNKRFQKKEYAKVEPFMTEKKGWGLRATDEISEGSFVLEYVGEVLDSREFKRRVKYYAKDKNKHFYFMALKNDEVIDATMKGCCSRFINHSCDPNAETQKWTVNGDLRIGFFAIRAIAAGEEVTFDYQFQRYGREAQRCYCEARNCRGYIGGKSEDQSGDEDESEEEEDSEEEEEEKVAVKERKPRVAKPRGKKKKDVVAVPRGHKKKQLLDDMDLGEEIMKLANMEGGLRNRSHTLTLSRLMVRAEDSISRSSLLDILFNTAETACLRLFLDYHGLNLVWGWLVDLGANTTDRPIVLLKLKVLETLRILPISNRTIVIESKVMGVVQRWEEQLTKHIAELKESLITRQTAVQPQAPVALLDLVFSEKMNKPDSTPVDSGLVPMDISEESSDSSVSDEAFAVVSELLSRIVDAVVTKCAGGDSGSSAATPTDELENQKKAEEFIEETIVLLGKMRALCATLVTSWGKLKEAFKIPKKQQIENRKEHEREADRNEGVKPERVSRWDRDDSKCTQGKERERERERDERKRSGDHFCDSNGDRDSGVKYNNWANKKSRFDDDRNFDRNRYNPRTIQELPLEQRLSKYERRQLFEMKVAHEDAQTALRRYQEDELRKQQDLVAMAIDHAPLQQAMPPQFFYDQSSGCYMQAITVPMTPGGPVPMGQIHIPPGMPPPDFGQLPQGHMMGPPVGLPAHLLPLPDGSIPATPMYIERPSSELSASGHTPILFQGPHGTPQQNMISTISGTSGQLMGPPPSGSQPGQLIPPIQGVPPRTGVYFQGTPEQIPGSTPVQQVWPPQYDGQMQMSEFLPLAAMAPPPPPPPQPDVLKPKLPPKWKTAKDPEGRLYYYHSVTKVTQWEAPLWEGCGADQEVLPVADEKPRGMPKTPPLPADEQQEEEEEEEDFDDTALVKMAKNFRERILGAKEFEEFCEDVPQEMLHSPPSRKTLSAEAKKKHKIEVTLSASEKAKLKEKHRQIKDKEQLRAQSKHHRDKHRKDAKRKHASSKDRHHKDRHRPSGSTSSRKEADRFLAGSGRLRKERPFNERREQIRVENLKKIEEANKKLREEAELQPIPTTSEDPTPFTKEEILDSLLGNAPVVRQDEESKSSDKEEGEIDDETEIEEAPTKAEDIMKPDFMDKLQAAIAAATAAVNAHAAVSSPSKSSSSPGRVESTTCNPDSTRPTAEEEDGVCGVDSGSYTPPTSSIQDAAEKRAKDVFRAKMGQYMVQCLNPFRKADCRRGKITSTEDFKHLARKLTHYVMAKELKHCERVEELQCNDSVKHKTKDYVKKYMSKFASTYKPTNSPQHK